MKSEKELLLELKRCVLCGSCKASCPTYFLKHSEALGPRGRIRLLYAVLNNEIVPSPEVADRVFSCLLCGACNDLCPSGVDINSALISGRGALRAADRRGRVLGWLIHFTLKNPALSSYIFRAALPFIKPSLARRGIINDSFRLDRQGIHDRGSVFSPPDILKKRGRVILFSGCNIRYIYPHLGESFIRVCNSLGYEVVLLKGEVCCGAPLVGLGLIEEAEGFIAKNTGMLRGLKADAVVSLCPTCVVTLRRYNEPDIPVLDSAEFLSGRVSVNGNLEVRASYHDPCHSMYGLKQSEEPRGLLRRLGVELSEMPSGCCGLAGTFSLRFSELSGMLLRERAEFFSRTGADILVSSCPGCIFQLSKAIPQDKVFHIVEVVEDALSGKGDEKAG